MNLEFRELADGRDVLLGLMAGSTDPDPWTRVPQVPQVPQVVTERLRHPVLRLAAHAGCPVNVRRARVYAWGGAGKSCMPITCLRGPDRCQHARAFGFSTVCGVSISYA